ncbi:MAG TPA: DUF4157 domain-containing protein [Thermoanaerobaculia bacterium]|nr:DUF4157 domain-containing protein [Thermoanaerobaculia bacterium]
MGDRFRRFSRITHPSIQRSRLPETRGWTPEEDIDGGQRLDPHTREAMESRFGHDFSRIRIHTGPEAARRTEGLGAQAYTLGLDVHFGEGRYRPGRPEGQALIAHELGHVARAGAQGPAVPMLWPQPSIDHEANLRKIFTSKSKQSTQLKKYLATHPDSIGIAEQLLASKATGPKTTVLLLKVLFKQDPKSEERVAELLRANTDGLRQEAVDKTTAMWSHYEEAVHVYAVAKWAKKRRDEEKKKRPKPPKPPRGTKPTAPEPTPEEQQFEAWRVEAQARFDALAAERKETLAESNAALEAMMRAADPVPYVQGDVLERLADALHGGVDRSRRVRVQTWDDVSFLNLQESPSVKRKRAAAAAKVERTRKAETNAVAKRQKLEPAPAPATPDGAPPAPETGAQKRKRRAQEAGLAKARRAETKATEKRVAAEKATTLEGTTDPEVLRFLQSQDPGHRKEVEAELAEARGDRDQEMARVLPAEVQVPGLNLDTLLDDKERWWIYHTALNDIGAGVPGFSHEHTLLKLVVHRSAVSSNRKALGVAHDVSVGTYHGHGEGQYDIHSPAGREVKAVQPDTVDLTRILGLRQGSADRRLFQRVDTQVRSLDVVDAGSGNEDLLAKLSYGYFGRKWKDRDKMVEFLGADAAAREDLPKPASDASRVIGGLVMENVIAGTAPTPSAGAAQKDIRQKLEAALHAKLRTLDPPVDIPDTTDILATVDASRNSFGGISMITQAARDTFKAVQGRRPGKKPYATNDKVKQAVFKATREILKTDTSVSEPLEKLISDLLATGDRGNRSGPHITLIHRYREEDSGKEVFIEVDYRHMHQVAALKPGDVVDPETVIGKVGSSGNAVSPHIHMAIRVYERDPRGGRAVAIGYLVPLEFFPFDRAAAGKKPEATPEAEAP